MQSLTVPQSDYELQIFLECEGNLTLAVEKAKTTRAQFLFQLSKNPEGLKQALHTILLINLADTLPKLQQTLLDLLKNLEPADAARTYAQIANIVAHISAPTQANPTVNQFNMNNFTLTPEIREALTILQSNDLGASPLGNNS